MSNGPLNILFYFALPPIPQVSFLHVYHHISIAWAWWIGLYIWPGGDSYFGALLNSWIHVMMYSYYTLSLLKINCPWKRFLTQAQLLQFTSVVIYSICSAKKLHDQQAETKYFVAIAIQVFEMVSLFFLFMHFYSKAYSKNKAKSKSKNNKSSSDSDNGSDNTVPEQESVSSDSTGDGKKDS
jgi:elongation of very long chain fatty acids protein 4